jgi:serine/threonine protein kinase
LLALRPKRVSPARFARPSPVTDLQEFVVRALCPGPDVLSAFRSGSLPGPEFARIAEHLRACAECRDRFADLVVAGSAALITTHPDLEVPVPDTAVDPPPTPAAIGPYRVVGVLGRGGMGVVYEAVHAELGSRAAVKVLARTDADPDAQARFRREWLAVGRLDHPNVVRALTAGTADGVAYLGMELVDGPDAGKLVRQLGPLAPADAAAIVAQVARGLAHAHAGGVVHRDVKPSNVLLAPGGVVKLLDLGLAQLTDQAGCSSGRLTRHTYLGTADFMAPEQWDDPAAVGPPTDVYALGCVLCKLLTGRVPFAAPDYPSPRAKMLAHQDAPPPELPGAPAEFAVIFRQMMAKRPADRPDAAAVAVALTAFAADARLEALVEKVKPGPGGGYTDGPPTVRIQPAATDEVPRLPARRRARRRWVVPAVAATAVTGIVAAAAAFAWPGRNADRSRSEREPAGGGANAVAEGSPDRSRGERTSPNGQAAPPAATLEGFGHPLVGLAFDHDGRTAYTAELDGTLRRWDVAARTGIRLNDPKNPKLTWKLRGLHLAPAGDLLAAFSYKSVMLSDAATGQHRRTLSLTRNIWSVAVSADGKWLAVGHDTEIPPRNTDTDLAVALYDLATGERTAQWTSQVGVRVRVTFGPDGLFAADGAGRTAVLHREDAGQPVAWSPGGPGEKLISLSTSSDGRKAVLVLERSRANGRTMVCRCLDLATGAVQREKAGIEHANWFAKSAAFGADARVVVFGTSAGTVYEAWPLSDEVRGPVAAHGSVACVAVSADGRRALTAGADEKAVKLWELADGR